MTSTPAARAAAIVGLVCALMVLSWQFLTVRYNYHGDWSALFCTGARAQIPPVVVPEHPYVFPGVMGWDGQWYHAIAHDPLLRHGTVPYLDSPRLRYRRILVPALAYLLAFGNHALIDTTYRAVILFFFGLGAWWLARIAQACGRPAVVGIVFFFFPASIAAIDREAIDVALLCFCVGFALYTRYTRHPRALYAVLLFAGLVRETGFLLLAGYCLWLLLERNIRKCAVYGTAALPALGWYAFVARQTPPYADKTIALPFSGAIDRLIHAMDYPGNGLIVWLIRYTDLFAVIGCILALLLAFRFVWHRRPDAVDIAIVLYALLGIVLWYNWREALDYCRILSPLVLFEGLGGLKGAVLPAVAPLCLMLPRFGIQMGSQVAGVARGLLGG